jgi:hypothetical protein
MSHSDSIAFCSSPSMAVACDVSWLVATVWPLGNCNCVERTVEELDPSAVLPRISWEKIPKKKKINIMTLNSKIRCKVEIRATYLHICDEAGAAFVQHIMFMGKTKDLPFTAYRHVPCK